MNQTLEPAALTFFSEPYCKPYRGIAFDGDFFYLTSPQENKICKFDREFISQTCLETKRSYTEICYDSAEDCFWVSDDMFSHIIFKLDRDLKETDRIELENCCQGTSCICGLSYHCENDTILAAYQNCVIEVTKNGQCRTVLQDQENCNYSGVLSVPPYHAVTLNRQQKQFFLLFAEEKLIASYCFCDSYEIKDLIFFPCFEGKKNLLVLILLAVDSCGRPCLLKCVIELCGKKLCKCNFICRDDKKDCACDIIESIAQAECALAHILNAEGEKLQKAVKLADTICELLEINESVNRTITKITFLEQVLYAKLEALD